MTAASGVVHDEFHSREFAKLGGEFSMVQLWVNLPAKDKMNKPRYQSLDASQFTEVSVEDGKATATLIAGEFLGYRGPAMTHTPINIFRLRALEECTLRLDMKEGYTTLLFVLGGRLAIQEQNLGPRDLAVFEREGAFVELSMTSQSELLVLNAEPIDEPIVHYGPFVMNTESEIRQAILDFQAGKMGTLVEESGS